MVILSSGDIVKNLSVFNEKGIKVDKKLVHKIVKLICDNLNLSVNSLEFNFISSNTMIGLNKKYLRHNFGTDIITFDYSVEKNNLDGEIFISLHDAIENSKKYKVSTDNELLRLIVHGILHLFGLDDSSAGKRKRMKLVEDKLVKNFNNFSKGLVVKK